MTAELKRLRRRCEAIAGQLPLMHPFDVHELCRRVAEQRGRPIHLMPVTGLSEAHGVWLSTDTADLIFYEDGTALPHQEHIILHELSHLLCGHYRAGIPEAEHIRSLLPHLDFKVIRTMLARTSYQAAEEQEAELLASIIRHQAERLTPNDVGRRIRAAFDWPRRTHG
ncbi:hypothetical protein KIPE111705_12335 [Kibdelosporangium persicum]|uniref:Toxin-antitoxin system, toxin component n=1 Tax=Kibdelosporangium persicum TaxID=2698649 RepID=A0ABX2F9S5_9PSEU|nr:hypothetical protein [Kibdelosporangium persicum]NRN67968.1 Toxin-antitoxin system, toxin component [Kibdelosporangium persicum]